jgi:MFS family permease
MIQLAGMSLGLTVGLIVDEVGLKRCMMTGLLILLVASALGGFASTVSSLMILRAAEGVGFLLVTLSAPGMIRHSVASENLKKMMGLWGAYMPLGAALALLLGPWIIQELSWQIWWWGLSVFTLSVFLLAWTLKGIDPTKVLIGNSSNTWKTRTFQTLTTRETWLLAGCFFMYSGQWLAVIGFLPVIYDQAGYRGHSAALLTALVAAVNMLGNIASGWLLDRRIRPHVLLYTGFVVMALSSVLAFSEQIWSSHNETGFEMRYAGVLLFSMVGGLIPGTLFSLATQLTSGKSILATTVGWMQQWSAFGQFSGPPIVAWVAVHTGGWQWTWSVTSVCSLAGMLMARQISKRI